MRTLARPTLSLLLILPCACADRPLLVAGGGSAETGDSSTDESASVTTISSGDGDGDPSETTTGDGDGDPAMGDGDGDPDTTTNGGDGDGDPTTTGDGDGDMTGDGDGDMGGDGDGDPTTTGDGDGDMTGDGDGDEGLVDIDGEYAITSTEVSVEAYALFLADDPGPELVPETCAWKTDYIPASWNGQLNSNPTWPVVRVDWCDAYAYCAWAGYHLCGEVGGGAAALSDYDNPLTNEWFRACSGGGTLLYPYGEVYDASACNGEDAGIGQLVPSGSLLTCEGATPGLYDMSGNAWEWTNACAADPNTPDNDQECRRRGGSYFSGPDILRCGISSTRSRDFRSNNAGIRCCL